MDPADTKPERAGETQAPVLIPINADVVGYIARFGGLCRDCADENGICPGSGLPCRDAEKAIRHVIGAFNYGVANGFLSGPNGARPQGPVDLSVAPEVEYDEGELALSWHSADKGVMFSVLIHDGSVIGGMTRQVPVPAEKFWKAELPKKLVVVDPAAAGLPLSDQ